VRVPRMLRHEVLNEIAIYSCLATVLLVVTRSVLLGLFLVVERASRRV
jgi:hypothetical protein